MKFEGLTSPCTIPSRCRADGADGPSRSTAMPIPGLSRGRDDHAVEMDPAIVASPLARQPEHPWHQQASQVVPVDPLYLRHADAPPVRPSSGRRAGGTSSSRRPRSRSARSRAGCGRRRPSASGARPGAGPWPAAARPAAAG
jgi:hypothetical protein